MLIAVAACRIDACGLMYSNCNVQLDHSSIGPSFSNIQCSNCRTNLKTQARCALLPLVVK